MTRPPSRSIGDLTFPEVSQHLRDSSILLLPVGAIEQHGPHLPLNTDVVIAEELTRRIIDAVGRRARPVATADHLDQPVARA